MKKLALAIILFIVSTAGVLYILNYTLPAAEKAVGTNTPEKSGNLSAKAYFEEDLKKMSPLEFLQSLEKRTGIVSLADSAPKGWITIEHVDELIKLVDSEKPCAAVVSLLSSYLPFEGSTVGNEAMFLIDGYKSGKYPPALCSKSKEVTRNPEEYKKWWKEMQDAKK